MTEYIPSNALPGLMRPGMTVFLQGGCGEPLPLMEALAATPDCAAGVHFAGVLVPSINTGNPAALHPTARLTTTFVYGDISRSFAAGQVNFAPLHYSGTTEYLLNLAPYDMALIQISPPDADGYCSLGVSLDFVPAILPKTKIVVAEINRQMSAPPGSPKVALADIHYAVETDRPLLEQDTGEIPVQVAEIGQRVADLIDDGDCFQIGIGKLPAAILRKLTEKRRLGLHGGMVTDEVMMLAESGVITCENKTIDTGQMVCGVAVGSRALYDWCGTRDNLLFRPATYTHDPRIVARIDNFVSINSVLEIDLMGQANAETIAGRQVSGTGGLVDFIRSARMAKGGRSILALTATAGRKKTPKIVPELTTGTVVSGLRADVDYVVTEHGAARLKDKDIDKRAEALIAIAEPATRADMERAWTDVRRRMTG